MLRPYLEIHYIPQGGEPVLIGAGSYEDVARIGQEAKQLDAHPDPKSTAAMSPGTEHFFRSLGQISGVSPDTEAVLEDYTDLVERSRVALLERLKTHDNQ